MPNEGEIRVLRLITKGASHQVFPFYPTDIANVEPEDVMRVGWKLLNFTSYKIGDDTVREYFFRWPDLFKDAVLAGLSRGEDNVVT